MDECNSPVGAGGTCTNRTASAAFAAIDRTDAIDLDLQDPRRAVSDDSRATLVSRLGLAASSGRRRPASRSSVTASEPLLRGGDRSGREFRVGVPDVSEQLAMVEELSRTVERLERSNEELAELARITAHDLTAPLRALSGLVDLLPEEDFDANAVMTLEAMRAAIDRMQAMVGGAIRYAHVRGEPPAHRPVDLNELVGRVCETLHQEILACGATILADDLPTVYGDEHQLERVLQNLVSNALKYSGHESPKVRIAARAQAGAWHISVADQGPGVAEIDCERIFRLFERDGRESGYGIGLATCKRIVESHGGRIWVEANAPHGSIFRFTLPDELKVTASDPRRDERRAA